MHNTIVRCTNVQTTVKCSVLSSFVYTYAYLRASLTGHVKQSQVLRSHVIPPRVPMFRSYNTTQSSDVPISPSWDSTACTSKMKYCCIYPMDFAGMKDSNNSTYICSGDRGLEIQSHSSQQHLHRQHTHTTHMHTPSLSIGVCRDLVSAQPAGVETLRWTSRCGLPDDDSDFCCTIVSLKINKRWHTPWGRGRDSGHIGRSKLPHNNNRYLLISKFSSTLRTVYVSELLTTQFGENINAHPINWGDMKVITYVIFSTQGVKQHSKVPALWHSAYPLLYW